MIQSTSVVVRTVKNIARSQWELPLVQAIRWYNWLNAYV